MFASLCKSLNPLFALASIIPFKIVEISFLTLELNYVSLFISMTKIKINYQWQTYIPSACDHVTRRTELSLS
jgi:hypothetical protein